MVVLMQKIEMSVDLRSLFSCIFKYNFEVGYYPVKGVCCHARLEAEGKKRISSVEE